MLWKYLFHRDLHSNEPILGEGGSVKDAFGELYKKFTASKPTVEIDALCKPFGTGRLECNFLELHIESVTECRRYIRMFESVHGIMFVGSVSDQKVERRKKRTSRATRILEKHNSSKVFF